ncbi:MAG: hypothetical protein HN509_14075 [Halobacteriovoraceae bacterium]|jgi:hypothetical protein|nr:hypothetical protein [Halobacteriovoraceae bacterium]MBT5093644.1 hypothetical protein [Halobacteriovoraceae bacterium]
MEHNLREELRPSFILERLKESLKKRDVTLWQDRDGGKVSLPASLTKFPLGNGVIKFHPRQNFIFQFNSAKPIYFFEKERTVIFKSQICFQSAYELEVKIPEKILLGENRLSPRDEYLMTGRKLCFELEHRPQRVFDSPILDLADNGASFRIHKREFSHFYPGDKIKILDQSNSSDSGYKMAEIVHVSSMVLGEKLSPYAFKIGIKFIPTLASAL